MTFSPCERETLISINLADLDEGFFVFGTTEAADFRRLCRRIGGQDKLVGIHVSDHYWECKVPAMYLNRTTWAIGKQRVPRKMTNEQKAAAKARLLGSRNRSTSSKTHGE